MAEDWTVDIPLRTPSERQASKDGVTTTGTVLGRPAVLVTHGSAIRLKVSGFASQQEAERAHIRTPASVCAWCVPSQIGDQIDDFRVSP